MNKTTDDPFADLQITGWYPGHMLKAGRQINQQLKLVDLVLELRDARIPQTSYNPEFDRLIGSKNRCLVLTKSDLANSVSTQAWSERLARNHKTAVFQVDSSAGTDSRRLLAACRKIIARRRHRDGAERDLPRPPRIMICGIPNVGKSTLINRLATGRKTAVGPRPGVTRSQQWVRLHNGMELLDTPGVLRPRIEDKITELKLTLVGTIKDELVGEELLAEYLLWWDQHHGQLDWRLYGIDRTAAAVRPEQLLEKVGRKRGLLGPGGTVDCRRAAVALLHDFRHGRLGRVTLDPLPEDDR